VTAFTGGRAEHIDGMDGDQVEALRHEGIV
jgi:hypothetical protein